MSLYQLHAIYMSPVKTIITLKFTPCFQWVSVVSKENRLQTKIRYAIIADLVLQISTNSLAFRLPMCELSYHPNLDDPWSQPTPPLCGIVSDSRQSPHLLWVTSPQQTPSVKVLTSCLAKQHKNMPHECNNAIAILQCKEDKQYHFSLLHN